MPSSDLVERKRAERVEHDRKVLAVLAAAGPAGVRVGRDLADLTGLPERTVSATVARLEPQCLVRREGKRRVYVTPAGRSEVGAGMPGLELAPALEVAIACFPAEALRAFVRLQLAAIPARWHLADQYSAGWPGFHRGWADQDRQDLGRVVGLPGVWAGGAAGDPGGVSPDGGVPDRPAEARRGERDWLADRACARRSTSRFVCIDEWDKASRDVQQAAGGLLLGATADELEGERVELRPIGVRHPEHRAVWLTSTRRRARAPLGGDRYDPAGAVVG